MNRGTTGQALPTLDADVDEDRIELDHTRAASSPFSRDKGRPGTAEWIEDQAAAVRTIADRISDHGDRLDGRMQGKLAFYGAV